MSGQIYVIAAPSGGGKTTLVKKLLTAKPTVRLSVSWTTRPIRPNEVDSKDYHFVDEAVFQKLLDEDGFLEWAVVHGHYYGTPRTWIEEQITLGHDVCLEIDWQGAKQIQDIFPNVTCSIFILPPSLEHLKQRLHDRAADSPATIERRLKNAILEMQQIALFDYVIINDDLELAVADLVSIVHASGLTMKKQQKHHADLFKNLLG